jgi:hypothetical protein
MHAEMGSCQNGLRRDGHAEMATPRCPGLTFHMLYSRTTRNCSVLNVIENFTDKSSFENNKKSLKNRFLLRIGQYNVYFLFTAA